MPFGLPEQFAAGAAGLLADRVFGAARCRPGRAGPASGCSTRSSRCATGSSSSSRLHDREALLPREGQRRFLEADGWVAWPGPAMADFLRQFIAHNRMLEGGFVIDDRLLTLADIACPILSVVGTVDEIAPAAGRARDPPGGAARRGLRAGAARRPLRPRRRLDLEPRDAGRPWPAGRAGATATASGPRRSAGCRRSAAELEPEVRNRVGYGDRAGRRGRHREARSVVATTAAGTARSVRELTREAASQLPRLVRLEQVQPEHADLARPARRERAQRDPRGDCSSCSRTAPTPPARSTSGSTTSSAG